MDNSTPVVVLPCGLGHGSTAVVRSLGRLGVPVYGVDCSPRSFASRSRYCKGTFAWNENLQPAESVEFLIDVSRHIGRRPILICTTDDTVTLVAEHAAILSEWFIFPHLSAKLVQTLSNKKEMFCLANRLGMPSPNAAFPNSRDDVLAFSESASFPIMLKGINGNLLARRAGKKMFIVHNRAELLNKYDAVDDPGTPNLMLQEYVPGGDDAVCGLEGYFNSRSECLFAVMGKKLRQWPAYKGVTTLGVCLDNPAIQTLTTVLVKAVGYQGILDIGYRYDKRDGLYKVLDINPRIGCTFRLFSSCEGMDVARALYLDLTAQAIPQSTFREGRKWLVEDLDILASLQYLLDGKLSITEWLHSFAGLEETAYLATDDLLPFFAMSVSRARQLLKRIWKKALRRPRRSTYSANRWA